MTTENGKVLKRRFESLLWRMGGMIVAFILAFVLKNITLLGLNPAITTFIGLAIGEISKYYNIDLPILQGRKSKEEN